MHELRIGKLNSTLLSEIIKDGDEQRVNRLLGNYFLKLKFNLDGPCNLILHILVSNLCLN